MMHYLSAHWIELAGWTTTLLGIWLTTRRSLWCWPITLAADVLYLIVFYRAALLSDALLQAFFVVFTLYGWWNWQQGVREEGEVKIRALRRREAVLAICAGAVGSVVLGILARRLHAALPYLDATLTSYSLVASWWGARRHIANWWLWIVVDIFYVGEYIYKDLRATALLYAVLVVLAVLGLRDWRRAAVSAVA
jgi:nicotinamide mononucleotide transporter